ncbi:MAG: hypothetical protein VX777_06755 [Chlamydiota bacterium]|nr:hypothetical protein [Chlamydiota bacterium]
MTINHDCRVSNPICDIWGVQPPITQVNRDTQSQQLQSIIAEADQKIIRERDIENTKINEKILPLKNEDPNQSFEILEKQTIKTTLNPKDAVECLEITEIQRVKSGKTKLFAGFGGGIGVAVGAVGFVVNPLLGITTSVMGAGIGLGIGGIIGITAQKD